jgi:hypothetical protein
MWVFYLLANFELPHMVFPFFSFFLFFFLMIIGDLQGVPIFLPVFSSDFLYLSLI